MKTEFSFVIKNFDEIALDDENLTKWIASPPFALTQHPDVWFCVMYRPTNMSNNCGLYVEPLDLGSFATIDTLVSVQVKCRSETLDNVSRKMQCIFDSQHMAGHGWSTIFSKEDLHHFLHDNSMHIECQIEVLSTTPNFKSCDERFTFYDWSLNSFGRELDCKAPWQAFEFRSPKFSLASSPLLNLRLILRHQERSNFAQIHLVPAKQMDARLQMSYLIWVEDKRSGVRVPTWVKGFTFDFNNEAGRCDTQFIRVDQLHLPNSPFINRDALKIHCRIFHDVTTLIDNSDPKPFGLQCQFAYQALEEPAMNIHVEQIADEIPANENEENTAWEALSVATANQTPDEPIEDDTAWETSSVATANQAPDEPIEDDTAWETLSVATANQTPADETPVNEGSDELDCEFDWTDLEEENPLKNASMSTSSSSIIVLNAPHDLSSDSPNVSSDAWPSTSKPAPFSMQELANEITKMSEKEMKLQEQNIINRIWKTMPEEAENVRMPEEFAKICASIFIGLADVKMLKMPEIDVLPETSVNKPSQIQESSKIWRPPAAVSAEEKKKPKSLSFTTSVISDGQLQRATPTSSTNMPVKKLNEQTKETEKKSIGKVTYFMEEAKTNGRRLCEIRCNKESFPIAPLDLSSKSFTLKQIILQTNWSGNDKLIIELDEFSVCGVAALVKYLKRDELPRDSYLVARNLAILAHDLGIPTLKGPCTKLILKQLSVNNATNLLAFGIRNEMPELTNIVIEFAAQHFNQVPKLNEVFPDDAAMSKQLYELIRRVHLSNNWY